MGEGLIVRLLLVGLHIYGLISGFTDGNNEWKIIGKSGGSNILIGIKMEKQIGGNIQYHL